MPSPVQSNCDAHDTIANGQYGAVWSMGHTQQDDISVFCRRRTSNTTSPCRLLHIPVVLNDFHSRETTLVKIPITERRSPDIQRRKPIKYQAGMRSRHSGTRTCRRYGSSWESSR
ncbi:hypothetical protein TNCV_5114821 [Trichonephila clavipes]|nr:hypothetical protein TNCV_5114821 [Trichonephila clavipes]